ncbi:MAG: hypothetical protein F2718_05100, partial [Actinobacteria bacterium]|nr:hypothetical protein [Actinomycetota bacterium]
MLSKPGIEWIERARAHLSFWRSARNKSLGALTIAFTFVLLSNASQEAYAAPASAHTCAANVGFGGVNSGTLSLTKAGDGCAVIKYTSGGTTYFETFNYAGANQSWTVPTGVSTATFYLIGAGGGGGWSGGVSGGGGGFVSGSYSVTAGSTLTIIVGEGGGGKSAVLAAGAYSTPATFGGGGKGGSVQNGIYSPIGYSYASGGGRSAIRLSGASTDLATAAGGGGGGYSGCGAGGGGDVGVSGASSATGGTQSAGGTGGTSSNSHPGTAGTAYQGGNSIDEGGGGGGGYFGGGGGGDNGGGGGGSSYKTLLTGGITTTGTSCGTAGASTGLGYTVSYDANGATSGTAPADTTILVSGGGTLASNTGTLARTGFVFDGWNTSADGSGTSYAIAATSFKPLADTTLYAQWKSTITYNTNTATGTVPTAVITKGSASGTFALNSGSGLTKTGLTFAGWNTAANGSGTNYAGSETFTSSGDITLYAIFRPSVSYNANGANTGSVPATVIGSSITVSDNVGSLVRTGYTLTGWNTASNGTGTHYNFLASLSPSVGLVLYAEWSGNSYAITFNSNGGTGTMADSAIVAGTAKNLSANTFTRTGYSFQGWTTNADGSGTTYTNSQSVTLYANTTIYAKWLGNSYTLTFGNTPGTTGSRDPCGCAPAQAFTGGTPFSITPNVWYRTGYIFAGWSLLSGNGQSIVYAEGATVTLYANTNIVTQWSLVYTVTFSANSGTGTAPTAREQTSFGGAITLPATAA